MSSAKSRYPFAPIRNGAFLFVTDQGCYYTVDISKSHQKFPDNHILQNNEDVFEISFDKTCDNEPVYDEVVSGTITYILGSNMVANGDTSVHFYVCESGDGHGKTRARLFDLWHVTMRKEIPTLEKYNFIVPGFNEDEYDVTLFIFENHPTHDEYISEFEKCLNENFSKG